MTNKEKFINTLLWGLALWFVGYVLGIILFFVVPKDMIGWVITPLATLMTVWVLLKNIKRPEFMDYFGIGVVWTVIAMIMDFIFLVVLFKTGAAYYKPDVLLYYFLTFTLPLAVGYWKFK
jgi:hypothetical protein